MRAARSHKTGIEAGWWVRGGETVKVLRREKKDRYTVSQETTFLSTDKRKVSKLSGKKSEPGSEIRKDPRKQRDFGKRTCAVNRGGKGGGSSPGARSGSLGYAKDAPLHVGKQRKGRRKRRKRGFWNRNPRFK